MSVRYGFENADLQAIRGLTIIPARTAGIADQVGSLEVGKDADIVVMNGDPSDPRTAMECVLIDGAVVYDVERNGRRW